MKEQFRKIVVRALAAFDREITHRSTNPAHNLLGLTAFPITCILDIGANLGQYATFLSKHFPSAHIFSFEPIPEAFARLKNIEIPHFTPLQIAVGERNGVAVMEEHMHHNSSSSFLPATGICHAYYPVTKQTRSIEVPVMTLDTAVTHFQIALTADLLIKVDVQGFEDRVIRGGPRVFRSARACIAEICLDQLYEKQGTFPEIVGQLTEFGFEYAGNLEQSYATD